MRKKRFIGVAAFIVVLSFIGQFASSQSLQFLPPIPYYSTNPYKTTMWNGLQLSNPAVVLDFADADELQLAAYAYMHPQSPYYLGASTYTRLITLLDSTLTDWKNGNRLADITNAFQGCFAYDMLKTLYPSKIPSNRKAIWEVGIRKQIDACFLNAPTVYLNHYVRDVWLNGHQRLAMAMFFGGNALGDSLYQEYGRYATEEVFTQCLLGDGGTHYLSFHNEASTYHPIVVKCFLDYWLVTQSTKVFDLLKGLEHFAPLNQHMYKTSNGYSEYSTGPSNKCYYNGVGQAYAAAVSAYISNDGYNWTIGKSQNALELGFIYHPGLTAKAIPDSFMLYDAGTKGPRGKYGNWGVVATARDPSSALPEHPAEASLPLATICEGKATFVGAFVLDTSAALWKKGFPLNAAFHAAGIGVKTKKGKETEWGRGAYHSWLTVNEHNGLSRGKSLYGISTRYQLNKTGGRMATIPWEGMQQWVITQDRIIGMMEIQAQQKQSVYGLKARLLLVSGRKGVAGTRKSLVVKNSYTYDYGMLKSTIHSQNFNGIVDTQYVNIIPFTTNDDFSAEIELHDKLDSAKDVLITYPARTKRYALVEVTRFPKTISTAATYTTKDTGLVAFQFQEQLGRKVRMIHNITPIALVYTDTMYCPFSKASLLRSWNDTVDYTLAINAQKSSCSITIPAYSHILWINSNLDSDHVAAHNTYTKVFKPVSVLPISLKSFQAIGNDSIVTLSWTTANEWNNAFFQLQKSFDGIHFKDWIKINTTQETVNGTRYETRDSFPSNGKNYYRLVQFDKDGKHSILATRVVNMGSKTEVGWKVVTNPSAVKSQLYVVATQAFSPRIQISIQSISGQKMVSTSLKTNNEKAIKYNLPATIVPGMYILTINNDGVIASKPFQVF